MFPFKGRLQNSTGGCLPVQPEKTILANCQEPASNHRLSFEAAPKVP